LCTISPENKPPEEETPKELSLEVESPEEKRYLKLRDFDILFKYRRIWDRNKFVVDNIFAFNITRSNNSEFESQTVEKCRRRNYWPMWNSNRAILMGKI
jgi:hypothetical protein